MCQVSKRIRSADEEDMILRENEEDRGGFKGNNKFEN
jgi:hypothetical protein